MDQIFTFAMTILSETWELFLDASLYILFGILVAGLLKMFLSPETVARHLGKGKYSSVFKAALFGIPIPLCSCGVLPAAASLKKQGASNGATTAFLISTPESGVDSISITYALLDPIMTIARPLSAFVTAITAGIAENLLRPPESDQAHDGLQPCQVDDCCDGSECDPVEHRNHHGWSERARAGLTYAFGELWGDLVGWFLIGMLLAGIITASVPEDLFTSYLGGGLTSMLIMLLVGIPLYICATASTPIAAALILKGVSPGAALVFLLVGPATNLASMTVLTGFLGKKATALYLGSIAVVSVLAGLSLDLVYGLLGINASAVVGQAGDIFPGWVQLTGAAVLIALSVRPIWRKAVKWAGSLGLGGKSPACPSCEHP